MGLGAFWKEKLDHPDRALSPRDAMALKNERFFTRSCSSSDLIRPKLTELGKSAVTTELGLKRLSDTKLV